MTIWRPDVCGCIIEFDEPGWLRNARFIRKCKTHANKTPNDCYNYCKAINTDPLNNTLDKLDAAKAAARDASK